MTERREKIVLIGGGVGPMAGVVLHRRIIEETATDGRDQDHLEVLHFSRPQLIGDRTEYLAGKTVEDPVDGMLQVFRMAAMGLQREGRRAVAGIPCNTFHAPQIFLPFRSGLENEHMPISLLNMLEETAELLRSRHPAVQRVGLLSTTGTRNSGVYKSVLQPYGYEVLTLPDDQQEHLHEAIYHRKWGLKAVSPASPEAVKRVAALASRLIEAGAQAVILGCTELPLAIAEGTYEGVPYIDPMTALARALVREAAPQKLRER